MTRIVGLSSLRRMADDALLLEVLHSLRERGAIGESSLDGAVAHAAAFVEAIPSAAVDLLDLGSGGGLPGLVIALRLPHLHVTLCDRRERRMDLLSRACARLRITDRVDVITGDVRQLVRESRLQRGFDVVTARAFGDPSWTMSCAAPFLRDGGTLIVSDPPPSAGVDPQDRYPREIRELLGFSFGLTSVDRVQQLTMHSPAPA